MERADPTGGPVDLCFIGSAVAGLTGVVTIAVSLTQQWLIASLQAEESDVELLTWDGPKNISFSLIALGIATVAMMLKSRNAAPGIFFGLVGSSALGAVAFVRSLPGVPSWVRPTLDLLGVNPIVELGTGSWLVITGGMLFIIASGLALASNSR